MDFLIDLFRTEMADLVSAIILIAGLAIISVIHFYWALGGTRWLNLAIPTSNGIPAFSSTAGSAFIVAFATFLFALILPGTIGFYSDTEPQFLYAYTPWILVFLFTVRTIGDLRYMGLFKRVLGTEFSRVDSMVFTPVAMCMAIAALVLAI
jgi:hypothetical protein